MFIKLNNYFMIKCINNINTSQSNSVALLDAVVVCDDIDGVVTNCVYL